MDREHEISMLYDELHDLNKDQASARSAIDRALKMFGEGYSDRSQTTTALRDQFSFEARAVDGIQRVEAAIQAFEPKDLSSRDLAELIAERDRQSAIIEKMMKTIGEVDREIGSRTASASTQSRMAEAYTMRSLHQQQFDQFDQLAEHLKTLDDYEREIGHRDERTAEISIERAEDLMLSTMHSDGPADDRDWFKREQPAVLRKLGGRDDVERVSREPDDGADWYKRGGDGQERPEPHQSPTRDR